MKLAMLFPYAPAYREYIYHLIDKTFDVDWYFCGNASRPLKLLNYNILSNVFLYLNEKQLIGGFSYFKNFVPRNFDKYDAIIISGDVRILSFWHLIFFAKRHKKSPKIFLWTHGWYGRESYIRRIIKKFLWDSVDGFFLYGNYAKGLMEKQGFNSEKLFVISNSLAYDQQLELRKSIKISNIFIDIFGNNCPTIIFIGRLTFEKKLKMLLNVVNILKHVNININVVLVGDGEATEELRDYAKYLNIIDNICFWGACYDEQKNAELIYNSDICVSPGNVGLTSIHAMMFGCPVITHNDYSHQGPEFEAIKEGLTGSFFDRDDVHDLARVIKKWLNGPGKERNIIRENCYSEIDNRWNPHKQIDVLTKVLQ